MKAIYVETLIRGSLGELWQLTRAPDAHQRWDLRFSSIDYLPRTDPAQPQAFRYTTHLGFGVAITGEGETVGTHAGQDGVSTSALRFWSEDGKSLIAEGSGYWQYRPEQTGVRFITRYEYGVRFGLLGRWFDALVFRPLIGWATAWSFDRLRLWIEAGIPPEVSLRHTVVYTLARLMVAALWIYQGVAPKLLTRQGDEQFLLAAAGAPATLVTPALVAMGVAELLFGLVVLISWPARWPLWSTVVLMAVALVTVALSAPHYLVGAFNPVSLNSALATLAAIALFLSELTPTAQRCRRRPAATDSL